MSSHQHVVRRMERVAECLSTDDWDIIGLALRERRPRYPYEGVVSCALLIGLSVGTYRSWIDLVFVGIGIGLASFLTVSHRAHMRFWQKGADSFRHLTGRDP